MRDEGIIQHQLPVLFDEIRTIWILLQGTGIFIDVVASIEGQDYRSGEYCHTLSRKRKSSCAVVKLFTPKFITSTVWPCRDGQSDNSCSNTEESVLFHRHLQRFGVRVSKNRDAKCVGRLLQRMLAISQTLAVDMHGYIVFRRVP